MTQAIHRRSDAGAIADRARTKRKLSCWRPSFWAAGAIVAMLLALAAPNAHAETTLHVAKVADDFALMMVDFGNEKGFFKKHGVDVDVTLITQAKMVQAVIAGNIDVALASGATWAFAAKGAPLKGIDLIGGPPQLLVMVVRPDESVTSIAQLKGRTAAITNVGSLTDWAVSQIAALQGWSNSDIPRVSVGDTPVRIAMLKSKRADAAVVDLAAGLALEEKGEAKILIRFGDLIQDFQNQVIFASDDALKNKRVAVKAFTDGWFETIDFAYGNRGETIAFAQRALRVSQGVAERVYDELIGKHYLSRTGQFDQKALTAMSKGLVDLKLADQEPDLRLHIAQGFSR